MTTELSVLAWSIVFGIITIMAPALAQLVRNGPKWAGGPRDEKPEPTIVTARLDRAAKNFLETYAFFVAAVLIVHSLGRENSTTALGAEIYLAARAIYLPLYAAGIPMVRTVVWGASLIGIFMVLSALA